MWAQETSQQRSVGLGVTRVVWAGRHGKSGWTQGPGCGMTERLEASQCSGGTGVTSCGVAVPTAARPGCWALWKWVPLGGNLSLSPTSGFSSLF